MFGDVYAGGRFNTAGSVSPNHIAKWDGNADLLLNFPLQDEPMMSGLREFPFSLTHSPQYRPQNDVPIFDAGMVTLQINRARAHNVGPKSPAGASDHRLVGNDFCAVEDHRDVPIDKRDVEGLPLASRLAGIAGWFYAGVD